MKIGVSAFAWTAEFREAHLKLLPGLVERGLEAFEVPMFDPLALPAAAIRRACDSEGIDCTVCAILPAGMNPISPHSSVRKQSLDHLYRCIDTAAAMGARLLGGPVYAPIGYLPGHRRSADEWAWAVECFQELGPRLDACEMTLSIEPVNRSESLFLNTAADAKALCEAVGHSCIGVTIDTFHANIEERSTPEAVQSIGKHLRHLHLSENDRGLLGSGHVDFPGLLSALRKPGRPGYEGYLMIEGFGYDPREPSAPGFLLASPNVSPEAVAYGGASYLRGLLHA